MEVKSANIAGMHHQRILNEIGKYVQLSEQDQHEIIKRLQVKKVRKKQYLVVPDEVCRVEHFINAGCFRAFYVGDDGKEYITKFGVENCWITDLQSFHSGEPATLYVEALEPGELVVIKKDDMEQLFKTVPLLNNYFRIIYQHSLIAQHYRVLSAISSTAEHQYLQFISRYPDLEQRVPQYMIASYLGVTAEFLSRIKLNLMKSVA